ncbi:VirB3 family type IV secretion system protein [uncultured Sneathiella sp.]|jgi:type IV secretion system protein VirB3|uniref:VirB3 family type IV secretion system protein n=1 Tax=uncultured Sneathiella sp. TaxID=879315 RepID=UPI0030DC7BAB|tara:strand:+ start:12486 stop:12761 length:276 start_codon:yes stop_codon:yes gene_type:complete
MLPQSSSKTPGFEVPLHRSLTEPILLAGAPRALTILNGTLAAAVGLGLRLWLVGILLWFIAHMVAVWATRKDPAFAQVLARHIRHKTDLSV